MATQAQGEGSWTEVTRSSGPWTDYTWIVVLGSLTAFGFAWSIGANDVANAFGTSVGAKTLTLWQACMIATVFEFTGALTLGGAVTSTIAKEITNTSVFEQFPEIYMYGMLCSLAAAGIWVTLATYWELAVSTTHSIVGAVIGFSLVWNDSHSVNWLRRTDSFPYFSGVFPIFVSWVTSPLIAAVLACMHFSLLRVMILRRKNSVVLAFWTIPLLVFKTILVDVFCVLLKGIGEQLQWDSIRCLWVAAAAAGASALLVGAGAMPWFWHKLARHLDRESFHTKVPVPSLEGCTEDAGAARLPPDGLALATLHKEAQDTAAPAAVAKEGAVAARAQVVICSTTTVEMWDAVQRRGPGHVDLSPQRLSWREVIRAKVNDVRSAAYRAAVHGLVQDVHEHLEDDAQLVAMHQAAEIFEPRAEMVFKYMQVISACGVSFAHGSNDVANAVGPLAAIYYIYLNSSVPGEDLSTPIWILVIGGSGIVVGLMTYGYNMMRALGVKMAKMTPSRGYSAELAVALTVAVASALGLPISTTHCIVGAEIGVGLCEKHGMATGVNWLLVAKTAVSWVATMVLAGLLSAAFFSQGAYAPSIIQCHEINLYQATIDGVIAQDWALMNASNGLHTAYDPDLYRRFMAAGAELCRGGQVDARDCAAALAAADAAFKSVSLLAVGYNVLAPNFTSSSVTVPAL